MSYHPRKHPTNEDRITKHRLHEDDLRDRLNRVHQYEHLMRRAEFEQAIEPKTSYRTLSEKLEAIRAQREQAISERRKNLRQFLEDEDNALDEEMKTGNLNLAERRAWLEAEAKRLRMERLEKMKKYADAQLDRAFRDSSDDVRIHNSKLAVLKAEQERKKQREENIQKRLQENEDEKALYRKMELEWEKQDELHRQELEYQKVRKQEAIDILHEQLGMVQRLREEERAAVEEDMRQMNRRWREEEEELKHRQLEQRCLDSQKAKELLLCNEQNRVKKLIEQQEEKKYDAHMIAMVSEREAEEERQEKLLKEAQRREAKAYAAQLRAAIDQQECEDKELEAIIKAEMEEEWRKKDEQAKHQEDLRKRLLHQVHEERHAQLQFKEGLLRDQEVEKGAQLEKNLADAEIARLEDIKRAEDIRLSKQEVMDYLESQIRNKKAVELVKQEVKRADYEGTKVAEKKYEMKVKKALTGLPYAEPYYGRKAVKWYE